MIPLGLKDVASIEWSTFSTPVWLSTVYVILFTTFFAYLLNTYGLQHLSPSVVSFYIYFQPLFATGISLLIAQETVSLDPGRGLRAHLPRRLPRCRSGPQKARSGLIFTGIGVLLQPHTPPMIRSMTGFGTAAVNLPSKTITVEIKSVNSKFFDLTLRLPAQYRERNSSCAPS